MLHSFATQKYHCLKTNDVSRSRSIAMYSYAMYSYAMKQARVNHTIVLYFINNIPSILDLNGVTNEFVKYI